MNLIHTQCLTPCQAAHSRQLILASNSHDCTRLSCPIEEGDDFFLLYDGPKLVSVLTLFFPEKQLCECSGFTLPAQRQKGHFTRLFQLALDQLEAWERKLGLDVELCFPVDCRNAPTMAVLEKLEAQYWYSEHMMALDLETRQGAGSPLAPGQKAGCPLAPGQKAGCPLAPGQRADNSLAPGQRAEDGSGLYLSAGQGPAFPGQGPAFPGQGPAFAGQGPAFAGQGPAFAGPEGLELQFFKKRPPGQGLKEGSPCLVGSCRLLPCEKQAYLHSFAIQPSFRGQGWGAASMGLLCQFLASQGFKALSLQVSSNNLAALGLYKKTGFRITETLSYYLY